MKNIAKPRLLSIDVPFPPLRIQMRFSQLVEKTRDAQERLGVANEHDDKLFGSLFQRAFGGEQ